MTEIRMVKRWPCAAWCDSPACEERVEWLVVFSNARPIDRLYLCDKHKTETEANYAKASA